MRPDIVKNIDPGDVIEFVDGTPGGKVQFVKVERTNAVVYFEADNNGMGRFAKCSTNTKIRRQTN